MIDVSSVSRGCWTAFRRWRVTRVCRLQEVIPTFDMAVNELFFERFPDSVLEFQIQVRPYNALKTRNMRTLNPEGVWIH